MNHTLGKRAIVTMAARPFFMSPCAEHQRARDKSDNNNRQRRKLHGGTKPTYRRDYKQERC